VPHADAVGQLAQRGFTREGVETWLPLSDDYPVVNVKALDEDPGSILTLVPPYADAPPSA
jgi:hypothetical protein